MSVGRLLALGLILILSGCKGGGSSGSPQGAASGDAGNGGSGDSAGASEFFARSVQPNLDSCRSCHQRGATADQPGGNLFLLSQNPDEDYDRLREAWFALGRGVDGNRLLTVPASSEHSGGALWPVTSAAHEAMRSLLTCWDAPDNCEHRGGVDVEQYPLLGSARGGHAWSEHCKDKPDSELLPRNPVSLIQPGVNEGKAVYFNAWYKNCHVDAGPEDRAPTTCGQWKQRIARGATLLKGNGAVGAGTAHAGTEDGFLTISAENYNRLWQIWGLSERPQNFDELVAERWGVVLGPERNPYPLPGEDPEKTNGGSGQLPTAVTQLRNPDGSWTGKLGATCHICHSGQVGEPGEPGVPGAIYGNNSLSDLGVIARDWTMMGNPNLEAYGVTSKVRGTGNITNFHFFALLTAQDKLSEPDALLAMLKFYASSPSTGTEDPPVWWNYGHRPLKFFDGGMSADAQRIGISFFYRLGDANVEAAKAWLEENDQDAVAWLLDRKAPVWPEAIDVALAEQGAVLFHSKDLWAEPGNAERPRPAGGNGSCASCHGAYSPRYVNDKRYLDDPALEGIAGYIVPRDLIGTDPARVDGNSEDVAAYAQYDWFAYPEQRGTDQDCGDQNLSRIRGDRENGYLAPPLYGVWATAPYFHNGSVPSVWEVLKSEDRKPIWRRLSAPNDTGLPVVMGFDRNFARGYDRQKLGWIYEEVSCGAGGALPLLECDPLNSAEEPLFQQILSLLSDNNGLAWNLQNLPPLTDAQVEQRKIYNTTHYSQGNEGHEFTDVLTDTERRAIIEYLKTL